MKIYYRDDPCGVGKTRAELIRMVSEPGRYILALDRRSAIADRCRELLAHAAEAGTAPVVQVLCSPGDGGHLIGLPATVQVASTARHNSVLADIAALPEVTTAEHLIVLVTHEGLRQSDLSNYGGWQLVIDEAPSAWEHASEVSPALYSHLQASYTLEPIEQTGWSMVRARDEALTLGDIRRDHTMHPWANFHRRVISRRGVAASVRDWSEVCSGRSWSWWSIWSPVELAAFDRVVVCAHAFPASLTGRLWAANWPGIAWERVPTPSVRAWAPRRVTICYAALHEAGTYFWSTPLGRSCLERWAGWIAGMYPEVGGLPHLYAANIANFGLLEEAGIGGDRQTIQVAGSNAWAHVHDVSVAYAGKASPQEATILGQLGVSSAQVTQAREGDSLVQFVSRSSVRDFASTADVRINLYDAFQARVVADYLERHHPFDVMVEHVEIGISEVEKPKRGRPPVVMSEVERVALQTWRRTTKAEHQRRRRAAQRSSKPAPIQPD